MTRLSDEPALQAELCALLADRGDDVVIHGDLHGRNVLRHGDGWRLIDPQAIRADRHAEIQPLLEASLSWDEDRVDDRDQAERWLHAYTTAAAMDPQRTRRFTVLRALTEARLIDGQPNPGPLHVRWADGLHRLADALRSEPGLPRSAKAVHQRSRPDRGITSRQDRVCKRGRPADATP